MRGQRGQATVETVALLPLVVLLGALAWQAVVAGQALWMSASAARAAARAAAVGADPRTAARSALTPRLARGLEVRTNHRDGAATVRVAIRVPSVLTSGSLLTVESHAAFPEQGR